MQPVIRMPAPYPDENCYSILCRYAVRTGSLSGNRICQKLFGNIVPLAGLLYKPFRFRDIRRWNRENEAFPSYGTAHSCLQYFSAFSDHEDALLLRQCVEGLLLTSGQAKRISLKYGLTKVRKKNLWYCPLCTTEDLKEYGETYWRRLFQMPGVSYCSRHRIRLRENSLSVTDINYQIVSATYAMRYIPDTDRDTSGNIYETEFLNLAYDTQWLLENGFDLSDNETVKTVFRKKTGKELRAHILSPITGKNNAGFEQYLAGRVLKDSGRKLLDPFTQRYLSTILLMEKHFGSVPGFYGL